MAVRIKGSARRPKGAERPVKGAKAGANSGILWRDGKAVVVATVQDVTAVSNDPHALLWLDYIGEPAPYMQELTRVFGLHHITTDTLLAEKERAKLTDNDTYFHLVVHGLALDDQTQAAATPRLDIIFGKGYIITLHRANLPWLAELRTLALGNTPEGEHLLSRGMPKLLYVILDTLTDSYFPVLDDVDNQIDELEYATVNTTDNGVQERIFKLKRSLSLMRRVISPQVEVTNALITRTGDLIPSESEPYFAEIHDHLVRAFEVIDSYRDLLSGLLDVYLSTVSNRLNQVMKQLAIIATIFMPITFITGVFGQNFGHSPQVERDGGFNFWLALLLMSTITAGQLIYFRRRGWI